MLTSVADAAEGATVSIRVADGRLAATITSTEKTEPSKDGADD